MKWLFSAVFMSALLSLACQQPGASNGVTTANTNTASTTKTETAKAAPTDLKQLAERIVNQSAGVKEGEIVLVSGIPRDNELIENIVIEIMKVGGHPLVDMGSEKLAKRSYTDVPEKFDSKEPKLGMALAKIVNVTINVDGQESEALLGDIPAERRAARAKAGAAVGPEFIKNKVRNVNVGNDLYPTEWRAKRFEMPLDGFSKLFWEGVNIDYTSLQATGEKARTAVAGKEMEITHPNGTSLKVALDSRPAYISDGIISADDVAKGNLDVYLPAGEVAVITAANSGTGKVIIEKQFYQGKEVNKLTLNFENGKLTSFTGEGPGFAALEADYKLAGEGKDLLSFVDIGINPNYSLAPSTKLGNWVSAGMVNLGTGNNQWAGGTNNATGGVGGALAGCTVKIDGKTIVENGSLKL